MKSGVPIWEQIRDSLKKQILAGALSPGEKLASVRTLAGELGINPNTIQRAYTELEAMGLVYTVAGRGCFVSENNEALVIAEQAKKLEEISALLREAAELGIEKNLILKAVEKEYEK